MVIQAVLRKVMFLNLFSLRGLQLKWQAGYDICVERTDMDNLFIFGNRMNFII